MSKFDDSFYIEDMPSAIVTEEHIYRILLEASARGASDVFITSNDYVTADLHGKKKALFQRKVNHNEVTFIVDSIAGKGASAALKRISRRSPFSLGRKKESAGGQVCM